MHVSAFMVPADKVQKCSEWDPVDKVLDLILKNKISAVVVIGEYDKAVGIVTKTDLVEAYQKGVSLDQKVGKIMVQPLDTILATDPRDHAAAMFERQGHHHAVVVNDHGEFVGLISAWDIAAECARDSRAWPWLRTDDGKMTKPAVH